MISVRLPGLGGFGGARGQARQLARGRIGVQLLLRHPCPLLLPLLAPLLIPLHTPEA